MPDSEALPPLLPGADMRKPANPNYAQDGLTSSVLQKGLTSTTLQTALSTAPRPAAQPQPANPAATTATEKK